MIRSFFSWLVVLIAVSAFCIVPSVGGCTEGRTQAFAGSGDGRAPHDTRMIDSINGCPLLRPVDARWQTLFEMLADDASYDNMHPSSVFEVVFGEVLADADIPRHENCQGITWGELKNCFDGDTPDYPGNDGPGGPDPNEPPDQPDPPDEPGNGD